MIIVLGKKDRELFKKIKKHIDDEEITFEQVILNAEYLGKLNKHIETLLLILTGKKTAHKTKGRK